MDDLLKAFQAEVSQDLDACEGDLGRLRTAADGAAAIANLHRLLGSIREMSVVLGQLRLSEVASRAVGALEVAQAGEPGAVARTVPIVADCLAQIRVLLQSLAQADADGPANRARSPGAGETLRATEPPAQSPAAAVSARPTVAAVTVPAGPPTSLRTADVASHGSERRRAPRWYRPRNVLFAGAGSTLAAVAAVVIAVLAADPNDYRGVFEETIRSATGRDVTIGNIDFAVSLNPTVVLQDVALANVPSGSRPQMIAAKRVEVQMALIPLLSGEFVAKRFVLHGADILLESDAQGRANWVFDAGNGAPGPDAASDPAALPQLGQLAIEESTLSYREGISGELESVQVERLTLRPSDRAALLDVAFEAIVNGQPVDLKGTIGGLRLLEGTLPYPIDLRGDIAGLAVTAKGEIAEPLGARGYALALTASGRSLGGLGQMLAADLPPGGPIQLTANLADADGALRIHDIAGRIGRSEMSGEVVLRPGSPNWRIDAKLASPRLDLQDFVAADADGGAEDPRLFPATPLPYAWIRKIDILADLEAQEIILGDTTLQGAALDGSITAGRVAMESLRFGYAGGQVALKGSGDVNQAAPAWALQGSARQLAGGEVLQLLGLAMISGGKADADFGLTATGGSLRDIATTLGGAAGITLIDGRIDDDLMRLFLSDLRQAVSLGARGGQLQCLTSIFDFSAGVGHSRAFVADTGAAVVVGSGDVSLRNETIDMTFAPAAKDVSLAALEVPVHVGGPLAHPSVMPDPVAATANVAGSAVGLAADGLAGVLGLVGADVPVGGRPLAACSALPANIGSNAMPATQEAKTPNAAVAPQTAKKPATESATQATTTTTKKKATRKSKSTTDQLLDDAGAVVDNIGSSIGDVFNGSTSSNRTKPKTSGSKSNK